MLTHDEMAEAISEARDIVLAQMLRHEQEVHGGKPCWGNRASAIAHLAHCLGVRGTAWDYAATLLREYDAGCAGQNCDHGKGHEG